MISSTASQQAAAAVRDTAPATATPRPSPLAAGTPRTQVRHSAAREQHTTTPTSRASASPWSSCPVAVACKPITIISATTPIGPTSPRRITIRERSAVHPAPKPSTVSARPSRCNARLPRARPPTTSRPTTKEGSPTARPSQPTSATAAASGSTASGAMIMARAAVRRPISAIAPDGKMVKVPTESRSASSMIGSTDRAEIGKQSHLAQCEDGRPQYRKRRKRSGAFTESHTKIKNWFQPELVQSQLLRRLGGAVASCAPCHDTRLEILGHGSLSDRNDAIEQHRYPAAGCSAEKADTGRNI